MFFIPQLGGFDCAFTCLKMMLANYNHDKNYLFLPHENRRYNFKELEEIASSYGTILKGIKVNDDKELLRCNKFPIIVTLNKRRRVKHAVLVLKANKRWIKIYDPAVGKVKMNTDLFFKEWTHRAMIVESCGHIKCPIEFNDYIDKKDKVVLPLLQVFGSGSLLAGTYFISESFPMYLPVIFFSMFVALEIMFRTSLIRAMKRMDEKIFSHSIRRDDETYLDVYKSIEKYRQKSLSMIPNLLYSFIISIFITVILIINDYLNVIYVILPLIFALVEVFIYKPIYKAHSVALIDKENQIEDVINDDDFKSKSREIHEKAYKVALFKNLFTYIEIGGLLISIVLVMYFTGTISITYILFYLCISFFLLTNFVKMFVSGNDVEEVNYAKAKLINSLEE